MFGLPGDQVHFQEKEECYPRLPEAFEGAAFADFTSLIAACSTPAALEAAAPGAERRRADILRNLERAPEYAYAAVCHEVPPDDGLECHANIECGAGEQCVNGTCQPV